MGKLKKQTFGEKLKEYRTAAGLSQAALAAKVSAQSPIGQSAIAQLESGQNAPLWKTVVALAAALGRPLSDFA